MRGPDADGGADVDALALRRLRWRARRGLLENDLVLERFFARHGAALSGPRREALAELLELPDGVLLDLILGRRPAGAGLDRAPVQEVLALLRAA